MADVLGRYVHIYDAALEDYLNGIDGPVGQLLTELAERAAVTARALVPVRKTADRPGTRSTAHPPGYTLGTIKPHVAYDSEGFLYGGVNAAASPSIFLEYPAIQMERKYPFSPPPWIAWRYESGMGIRRFKSPGIPRIHPLLSPGGPAHVSRFIISAVVYPVKGPAGALAACRALFRRQADLLFYVTDERPHIMPLPADCNSATAVIPELFTFRVIAPGHHARPGAIERVGVETVFQVNLASSLCRNFPVQASAGKRRLIPAEKIGNPGLIGGTTVTEKLTPAHSFPAGGNAELAQEQPAAEALAGQHRKISPGTAHRIRKRAFPLGAHIACAAQRPGGNRARAAGSCAFSHESMIHLFEHTVRRDGMRRGVV